MLVDIILFLLITLIVSVVSVSLKYDEPRRIALGTLRFFAIIVGGILLFCVIVQVLQAAI